MCNTVFFTTNGIHVYILLSIYIIHISTRSYLHIHIFILIIYIYVYTVFFTTNGVREMWRWQILSFLAAEISLKCIFS